jgi:hypothetical protein
VPSHAVAISEQIEAHDADYAKCDGNTDSSVPYLSLDVWICAAKPLVTSVAVQSDLGEAALAVICFYIFLKGPWEASLKVGLSGLFGHYLFWYWFTRDGFRSPTLLHWGPLYVGPFGMVLGFFALLVWGFYAYRTREQSLRTASKGTSDHPAVAS